MSVVAMVSAVLPTPATTISRNTAAIAASDSDSGWGLRVWGLGCSDWGEGLGLRVEGRVLRV